MNTKAEQNSQKGTKDHHGYSKNLSKHAATGKLMDNILSNMKTHIRKPHHQTSSNGMPLQQVHQSRLEPEYLNNILIDINDVNKLKTKHNKISALVKTAAERTATNKITTSPKEENKQDAHKTGGGGGVVHHKIPTANLVNSLLSGSKPEKQHVRPKSGIKRRLKKLIEYKKQSVEEDGRKLQQSSGGGGHSSKQTKTTTTTTTKKETLVANVQKEETSNNVQQISKPEQSINNNPPTSIAECNNKRDTKVKKTKTKDTKKKDAVGVGVGVGVQKEKTIEVNPDLLENNDKKTIKCKQKVKTKTKTTSNTSCPQTILAKTSVQSQQQSKKIKLLVNQIASNLKQTSCFELNTGNIKRDIYIKGLSTCMTSQALEQINRILNPPRIAAYRATITSNKNNTSLLKSNQIQNLAIDETSRPTTSQKTRHHMSKMNIANEINTFNKLPQQQQQSTMTSPQFAQSLFPQQFGLTMPATSDQDSDNKIKDIAQAQKDKTLTEKEQNQVVTEILMNAAPITSQEQELIKKINEKIDKIITSGLSAFDSVNLSTSSLTADKPAEESKIPTATKQTSTAATMTKQTPATVITAHAPAPPLPPPPLPPPPIDPINLKAAIAKSKEPARFMQAPNPRPNTATGTRISLNSTSKPNTEPRANESPPPTAQAQEHPNITNILNVVRNSEIVNNIKQNTITVLQNALSKSIQQTEKPTKAEKKSEHPKTPNTNNNNNNEQDSTTTKTLPLLKQLQLSTDNLNKTTAAVQKASNKLSNAEKTIKQLNAMRKPSKHIGPNSTNSTVATIGNRPTVITTHVVKNSTNLQANGTSSTSTLNLIAALSTSKKFNLLSPMEVVQDFVNLVNHAKRNRKTFTICGNFYSLRRAFAERGWIEKMRINIMEDRETWRKIESLSNFELVDGMRNKEVGEKYRRVFLTKLLAGHQVDFYWDYLTNPFAVNNDKIKRTLINRFPYGATRAYTSKYGLTESLRDAHWYCIDNFSNVYYPRTYNLSMIEEMASFVEDFRITAVIALLQWIVSNMTTPEKILSSSGDVPTSVYNFATIQCHNYIKIKEHRDIDEVIPQAKDYEWEVFLEKYYRIVHNENCFKMNERISAELMIEQSKYVLKKVKKYLPNLHLDGYKNMWLLKPNNGSRGCGIHVCRTLKYMMDTVNTKKDIKYVVQKYLERPLLIHKTKFDIRQWFLVTCMPNVKVWLYKECYLRFSSQMFDLNKLHESIHLTNNSVQCRYKNNNQRSTSLPEQNMWDSETFKKYLTEIGQPYAWRNNIYKGMKECLVALFMLCQSKMELRINSFELCGADFMLSEDYHPYLIEINSRPALYPSTKITARMCPKVLEDVIKVTVDHARNPKASTGDFELIYTDTFNYAIPRNVNNLYIEGMSYFSKFLEKKPSIALNNAMITTTTTNTNTIVSIQQSAMKEVKNDSIKKILNIDPGVVKIDVRNTLEKILAVVHNDSDSKVKESPEERNKKFRSMLSEFVSIISNVKNVNEEV